MKKQLFTLALAIAGATSASAQLAPGTVAPDFTFKDLNGNTQHLYDYLNSGKTVILDVSAAWCSPCWNYHHTVKALEDVWKAHGPSGSNGVNANTTNDVMVLMMEGESTNTTAQLRGTGTGGGGANRATDTQGDWVTGTLYPIIDTNASATTAFDQAWNINAFPTIYMICRDRLVYNVGQLSAAALYAAVQQGCPTYAPSTTTDAKAVTYTGSEYYFCNANPSVKFQNYSQTNTITAATIKTYSGTTLVNSTPWTGTLAPYAVATVPVTSFAGSTFSNYKYEVVVAGDAVATNNASTDSVFKVYSSSNASTVPYSENFENTTDLPYRYSTSNSGVFLPFNTSGGPYLVTSADGTQSRALLFDFYDLTNNTTTEFVFGNFNTASATNVALDFDVAHAQYTANGASSNDKLEVQVSKDCGATWTSVYNKAGATLATTAGVSAQYIPSAASQWRHETVNLSTYKDANMLVKFKGTSNYGNIAWVDNIKVTPTLSIGQVVNETSIKLFPNPAQGATQISFDLKENATMSVEVLDAMGRIVSTLANGEKMAAGEHKLTINTASFAAGVYNVVIKTEEGSTTKRFSVVK